VSTVQLGYLLALHASMAANEGRVIEAASKKIGSVRITAFTLLGSP